MSARRAQIWRVTPGIGEGIFRSRITEGGASGRPGAVSGRPEAPSLRGTRMGTHIDLVYVC